MNKKKYDEKQLIDRAKAFQNAFYAAIVSNSLIYILSDIVGISFENSAALFFNLGILISTYVITMIIRNAYDGINNSGEKYSISSLCGCGVALFIIYLPDVLRGEKYLCQINVVTESAGALFVGLLMILISLLYWLKQRMENKTNAE